MSFRGFDINYYALERPSGYRDVWPKPDRVHFLGDDLRRRAIRRGLPESLPYELIPPAVDAARYRPGRDHPKEVGGTLRLLSVGRLHWKKGYEYAVQAAV